MDSSHKHLSLVANNSIKKEGGREGGREVSSWREGGREVSSCSISSDRGRE